MNHDEANAALAAEHQFFSIKGRLFLIEQVSKLDPKSHGWVIDAALTIPQARKMLERGPVKGELGELLAAVADGEWWHEPREVMKLAIRCKDFLRRAGA